MNCAHCGAQISGAHEPRYGVPFCWRECVVAFEMRNAHRLDAAIDEVRVRYGLRPLSDYGTETKAAAE